MSQPVCLQLMTVVFQAAENLERLEEVLPERRRVDGLGQSAPLQSQVWNIKYVESNSHLTHTRF